MPEQKQPERKGRWIAHLDCRKCPFPGWRREAMCGLCATLSTDEQTGEKFVALRPIVEAST